MNKKQFLKNLKRRLSQMNINENRIVEIVSKYEKDITIRNNNKEKIKAIISGYGTIDEICEKELEKSKTNIFDIIKKKVKIYISGFKFKKDKTANKVRITNNVTNPQENEQPKFIKVNKLNTKTKVVMYVALFALVLISLLNATVFMLSMFAYLDGIKLLGMVVLTFLLFAFSFYLSDQINKYIIGLNINKLVLSRVSFVFIILIMFSTILTYIQINKVEYLKTPSEKHIKSNVVKEVGFSADKMYITFNSNYDTKYLIKYDDTLENKVKFRIDYYEAIYDLNFQRELNDVYISLKKPHRDLVSFYIDGLKDGKLYNINEYERYKVTIYVNSKDETRLVFEKEV